jgi:hypothetical protein
VAIITILALRAALDEVADCGFLRKVSRMNKLLVITISAMCAVAAVAQVSVEGPGGLVVQIDTTRGTFALGSSTGSRLMFNYNYPWDRSGNWITFGFDDSAFTNSNYIASTYHYGNLNHFSSGSGFSGATVTKSWIVPLGSGQIYFSLTIKPILIDGAGMAKIIMQAYNDDTVEHYIGGMMMLDIVTGTNDHAPLSTGTSVIRTGADLRELEVPYFWQAYEVSPAAGCEQVVARGFLRGFGATQPSQFVLADYTILWEQSWEVDTALDGRPLDDSAILIKWNKERVDPRKSAIFITYYGFGNCSEERDSVILVPMVQGEMNANCSEVESPFEIAALVHNRWSVPIRNGTVCARIPAGIGFRSAPMHPDTACVPFHPDTLQTDSTEIFSWLIAVTDTSLLGDTIPIIFDVEASPSVDLSSTTSVYIPRPDGFPPLISVEFPYRFCSCFEESSIVFPVIFSDESGIDPLSITVRIKNSYYSTVSEFLTFIHDTLYVEIPASYFYHQDTIAFEVISAADIFGCFPDVYPAEETLFIDHQPPYFYGFVPAGSSTVGAVPQIQLIFSDQPSGIDHNSVTIDFNGYFIDATDPAISWNDDTTMVFTSPDTFSTGELAIICLHSVSDNTRNCEPNIYTGLDCATYFIDVSVFEPAAKPDAPTISIDPNPFNSQCVLSLYIPSTEKVSLDIFDISGTKIASLVDNTLVSGSHNYSWNSENFSSGIYFAKALIGRTRLIEKIILIK